MLNGKQSSFIQQHNLLPMQWLLKCSNEIKTGPCSILIWLNQPEYDAVTCRRNTLTTCTPGCRPMMSACIENPFLHSKKDYNDGWSPTVKQITSKCTNLRLQNLIPPCTHTPLSPTLTSQMPFCGRVSVLHYCLSWTRPRLSSLPLSRDRCLCPGRLWVLLHWWISLALLLSSDCPLVEGATTLAQAAGERTKRWFLKMETFYFNFCVWQQDILKM